MNKTEFGEGTDMIETCLQGTADHYDGTKLIKPGTSFEPKFLDYLFEEVKKDVPKSVWLKICAAISKRPCKPRDLTIADFTKPLENYRDAETWKKARWKMAPPGTPVNRKLVYEKILADPSASESSKSLARQGLESLARGVGAQPGPGERKRGRVQGGEKYRRMKS